jgi:hypothetical protein
MNEIVDLVQAVGSTAWKVLCAVGVVALGFYVVDRGRRAAALERAEETRERRAA